MFRHRHRFDLFTDRERYHAVLCNSHLIPVVYDTALAIMSADAGGMAELRARHSREIHSIRGILAGVA